MRDRLLELRQELEAIDAADQSTDVVELDPSKVGRLSRMDAMQAQAMAKASAERRTLTLARIERALERIDNGEFGYCLRCEDEINPQRLGLDPTVTLCVNCAAEAESS